MAKAYPTIQIQAYLESAWTDISADVVKVPIRGKWGMRDNTGVDLVADTGTMVFMLDNQDDKYIPGLGTALTDWDKGTSVRMHITYLGDEFVRYTGTIDQLEVYSDRYDGKWVRVVVTDWMDQTAKYPIVTPEIATDQRADQGITTIVSAMPIAPLATSYETGQETFNTIFDNVTTKTMAMSELTKLVNSEFGQLYLQKDRINGETLVFEDRHFRTGLNDLDEYLTTDADLLLEDGDNLWLETGFDLLLETAVYSDAAFDNNMTSLEIQYGKDMVNRFTSVVYPKGISAAVEVLFSLESPMEIPSGSTRVFRTNYSDPTGGNQIAADTSTMVAPVATTDYLFNTQEDGGGSNITANLDVTADYGTEGVTYTLLNNDNATGYVTFLQARGKGVFTYSPIEDTRENDTSINEWGYHNQSINQRYQEGVLLGSLWGDKIVNDEKEPRVDLQKVFFSGNQSEALMQAFLRLDIGSLVHIKEDDSGIDAYYYIQGVEFTIELSGAVRYAWVVREAKSLRKGLTSISLEFDKTDGQRVFYGNLKHLENVHDFSVSAWINVDEIAAAVKNIVSTRTVELGWQFYVSNSAVVFYIQMSGTDGSWYITTNNIGMTWTHVVMTRAASVDPLAAPKFYKNAVDSGATVLTTPVGTISDQTGMNLSVGGEKTARPFYGHLYDVRIYNKELSSSEVSTIYNSGTPVLNDNVTDGLVFQSLCVPTNKSTDYIDQTLDTDQRLIDNIYGYVGIPQGGGLIARDETP